MRGANEVTTSGDNPFPAEAVASFGSVGPTYDKLEYMRNMRDELAYYVSTHADPTKRSGGAIGVWGSYGAGKTHLLSWVASQTASWRNIRSTVLYARFDSGSFFGVYRQLMGQMSREGLVELIQLARLAVARERVMSAKATETIANRLNSPDILQEIVAERNIDSDEVSQLLLHRITAAEVPSTFSHVVLEVLDPAHGPDAFRWLTGDMVEKPERFGVTHQLSGTPAGGQKEIDEDAAAINSLETIAALHRVAKVPLVMLFDQLEVAVQSDAQERGRSSQRISAMLKRLIEQISREEAYMVIAGTPEGWVGLTSDVSARLRSRVPLHVGGLSEAESMHLLNAYTKYHKLHSFPDTALTTIHELSGGSPREILRIAYHVFNRVSGELAKVDDQTVLASAESAGSIASREESALRIADRILGEFGSVAGRLVLRRGLELQRTLTINGEVGAALVVTKATDRLNEIDVARRLAEIRRYCQEQWPHSQLVIVTVGYSSSEVSEILGLSRTRSIIFREDEFAGELRRHVQEIVRELQQQGQESTAESVLAKELEALRRQLTTIEERRGAELREIQDRFSQRIADQADTRDKAGELRYRWQLLDALDRLAEAAAGGDHELERQIVHAVLVANEAYTHNALVERLATLYLELLALGRTSHGAANYSAYEELRADTIEGMRRSLRSSTAFERLSNRSAMLLIVVLLVIGVLSTSVMLAGGLPIRYWLTEDLHQPVAVLAKFGLWACVLLGLPGVYVFLLAKTIERSRFRTFRGRFDRLRQQSAMASVESATFRAYPQAR